MLWMGSLSVDLNGDMLEDLMVATYHAQFKSV